MARSKITRETQLAGREDVKKQLLKIFDDIQKGFVDQVDRSDQICDFWDAYNCRLQGNQYYSGNNQLFIPLIHNAIEALKTRFLNRLFPMAGRNIDVTTEDGQIPHAEMALLEMYTERASLKTKVVPPMLVAGNVEGQYTGCVTWSKKTRYTVVRTTKPITTGGIEHPDLGETHTLDDETITDSGPELDLIPDPDFLLLPATAESLDEAMEVGGSATALCRWSKERVQKAIDDEEIDTKHGADLIMAMTRAEDGEYRNIPKKLADAAGIKAGGSYALIHRTWARIKVGKDRRLVLAYYAGNDVILGAKLCPYWCDKPDYISRPVLKSPGVFKGRSPMKPCMPMQLYANDILNEGADVSNYSMLPVVMTDPEKNPKIGSMVMDLMAVWETSPRDTQIVQFPPIYQHAFNIINACERYINQTLGVNASMIPQSTGVPGRKRNQAEVALEQQVDLMSTDVGLAVAEDFLSEVIERFAEYDAQFRDNKTMVRTVGELGVKAQMVTVPPGQMGKRWRYRWFGVEASRTAQQIQQQISLLNVLKEMSQDPAVQQAGYRINPVPLMRTAAENAFGPRMAPEIFESIRDKLSMDQELENVMLAEGMHVTISPLDDDATHLQKLMPAMQASGGDPHGVFREHAMAHNAAMQAKNMQQMQQAAQMQGGPGGGQRQIRGPNPGSTPQPPRIGQQPNGAIHPDQMRGPGVSMPRRM